MNKQALLTTGCLLLLLLSLVTGAEVRTGPSYSQRQDAEGQNTQTGALEVEPDTAASVRWTLFALQEWEQAGHDRLQARVDAARGDRVASEALRTQPVPLPTAYPWALLALVQHNAAQAVPANAQVDAVIAAASAKVLSVLLPSRRETVQSRYTTALRALPDTVGAEVGRQVARARIDRLPSPSPPTGGAEYVGEGAWQPFPGTEPHGWDLPGAVPFVLDRADRFRPPPPPVPGSVAFAEALAEVRAAAENRTPAQRRVARFWVLRNGGTEWARRAAHLIAREGVPDPKAAAIFARLHAAIADATIACFEAKYHYGLLRPEHADATITRPWAVALPNFPAYPAGHACTAGAAETILVDALPGAGAEIQEAAHEMAESRLWGGVHYRFDNDAGLALGRNVARYVLAHPERLTLPTSAPAD